MPLPDRFATTHAGSLPRPGPLLDALNEAGSMSAVDEQLIDQAVVDVVQRQVEHGLDLVSDGEMGRAGFSVYVRERLAGFGGELRHRFRPADLIAFPAFGSRAAKDPSTRLLGAPACDGPVALAEPEQAGRDVQRFVAALRSATEATGREVEGFLTSASPGVVALYFNNEHYPDHETYVRAIAEAMRTEYQTILDAGLTLQIDAPDLAMGRHVQFAKHSVGEFRAQLKINLAAIEHALDGLPAERVRLHICWGNYEGPHTHDVELSQIVDLILAATPATLVLEGANPRHAHEWSVLQDVGWPEEKFLVTGTIDTSTNYVEHPELVAERLLRLASIVGEERLMAGTDCGFGTFAGQERVDEAVAWAKLDALVAGATRAREAITGRAV